MISSRLLYGSRYKMVDRGISRICCYDNRLNRYIVIGSRMLYGSRYKIVDKGNDRCIY